MELSKGARAPYPSASRRGEIDRPDRIEVVVAQSDERKEAAGAGEPGGAPEGEAEARGRASDRRIGDEAPLAEMFSDILGKLWRRSRVEVGKAVGRGRDRLTLRQLRGDRDRMYQKLGKETRHLLEANEIDHPGIRRGVERIRELEARLLEAEDAVRARGGEVVDDAVLPEPEEGSEE
jgi:hypothetical protein